MIYWEALFLNHMKGGLPPPGLAEPGPGAGARSRGLEPGPGSVSCLVSLLLSSGHCQVLVFEKGEKLFQLELNHEVTDFENTSGLKQVSLFPPTLFCIGFRYTP